MPSKRKREIKADELPISNASLKKRPSDDSDEDEKIIDSSPKQREIEIRSAQSSLAKKPETESSEDFSEDDDEHVEIEIRGAQSSLAKKPLTGSSEDFSEDDDEHVEIEIRGAQSSPANKPETQSSEDYSENDDEYVDDDDDDSEEEEKDEDSDEEAYEGLIVLNKPPKGTVLFDEEAKRIYDEQKPKFSNEAMIWLNQQAERNEILPKSKVSAEENPSFMSKTRFDQCSISPLTLKGVKDLGYENMTIVQEATLPVILAGKDVFAKARTGTGKTVAFLLPAIEVIVKSPSVDCNDKMAPIYVLVLCPTRELANQAAREANTLLKYHTTIGVQVVIGGTSLSAEREILQANPCHMLIATPRRLRDHTKNTAGFAARLMGVKLLVLDEADQLLDMGFLKEIQKIVTLVPKKRQTLLFSATVREKVRLIGLIALKKGYQYINTVKKGSQETHSQVKQMHLVAPVDNHFSLLYALLKEHIADDVDYKIIVFCATLWFTALVANLLSELNMNVLEIHSRKSQNYRTRISEEFRKSKGLILVTSDVSARGVDYPDVTLIIQFGLPTNKEQYIHRLGRTGRIGKVGEGILLLAPYEEFFLSKLKNFSITKASAPSVDPETTQVVETALSQVKMKKKEAAYIGWLCFNFYNKFIDKVARDKCHLVKLANEFSRSMGLDNPPAIPNEIAEKLQLLNVPGLQVHFNKAPHNQKGDNNANQKRYS